MKLFSIRDPVNLECARVAPVDDIGYNKCETCGYYIDYPKPDKRTVKWLEGSNVICSFVWVSRLIAETLVTGEVRGAIQGSGGVEFLPVEFYQEPGLRKPRRITKRIKSRVWLPYEGPPLFDLWVSTWVHADLDRSSLSLVQVCPICGRKVYKIEGIEERKHRWDAGRRRLIQVRTPRVKGKGIYVHYGDLQGVNLFRLYELPGQIFCTERIKAIIEEKQFTNVWFLEVGEVVR